MSELTHLISCPCGVVTFKELSVFCVDGGKVIYIRKENCRLDHIVKCTVGCLQDKALVKCFSLTESKCPNFVCFLPTHVGQRLLGFGHYPSFDYLHGLWDETNLPRNVKSVVDLSMSMVTTQGSCHYVPRYLDSLVVGPYCVRGLLGRDDDTSQSV